MVEIPRNNESNRPDGTDKSDANASSTRRHALKLIGGIGAGSLVAPTVKAVDNSSETDPGVGLAQRGEKPGADPTQRGEKNGLDPDWWEEIASKPGVEKVAEGAPDFISENREAPDWFTIGENDDLRYKPLGIYRSEGRPHQDELSTDDHDNEDDFTTQSTALCLPTHVEYWGMDIGVVACHYGGCEWSLELCAAACVGTGMQDDCSYGYHLTGSISTLVEVDVFAQPVPVLRHGTINVYTLNVEGELCHYWPTGERCYGMDIGYNFDDEEVNH